MRSHLAGLERIADSHRGTRVAGSAGYDASVDYVRDTLAEAGYEPRVLPFPFLEYRELVEEGRQLRPQRRPIQIEALDYSPPTSSGGIRGELSPAGTGCSPNDFAGARGRIAVATRGVCFAALKAQNARQAGAIALLVFNPEQGPIDGTLGDPNASRIPVAAIEEQVARTLIATPGAVVSIRIRVATNPSMSQNVVADAGDGDRVLLVGAHLDSVIYGPGINDNGTGVAALLEIARVLREQAPHLAVRFAFWGAEEFGLIGSREYAGQSGTDDVVGYLNFDMLGSNTAEYAVYQGPYAHVFLRYFTKQGIDAHAIDATGRSDHFAFEQRGVRTGGLFAGFDACYHSACDRIDRVSLDVLAKHASAAAFAIATLAPVDD
jgi:Zn-dependent M28 family amino/carboxypeptidase